MEIIQKERKEQSYLKLDLEHVEGSPGVLRVWERFSRDP